MSYDQAPYWLWPLDRWKLLLTIVLALLLLLLGAIQQPQLEAVPTPDIENPLPNQSFEEGELVTISGAAGNSQEVRVFLCSFDGLGSPQCDEGSAKLLADSNTDATGSWQVVAPPLPSGKHANVAATVPDESGQVWTNSVITFQVLPAPIVLTAPSFNSKDRANRLSQPLEITGQAGPGNTVFLFADTLYLGRADANDKGFWRFETPELEAGTHFLVAKVLAPDGEPLATSEPLIILIVPE